MGYPLETARSQKIWIVLLLIVQSFFFSSAFAQVEVLFSDGSTVDFKLRYEAWGNDKKAELRRVDNNEVIASWENQDSGTSGDYRYYSDYYEAAGGETTITYQMWYYEWNEAGGTWDYVSMGNSFDVETSNIHGTLHNDTDWLTTLNRTAIIWSGVVPGEITDLTVADGDLIIEQGSLITLNGNLQINSPAIMYTPNEDDSVDHQAMFEGDGYIIFDGYNDPFRPLLRKYFLADKIRVQVQNCIKVSLVFNQLGPDEGKDILFNQIYVYSNSTEVYLAGNHAGRISVNNGDNHTLYQNNASQIEIYGTNNTIIEDNTVASIGFSGNDNTVIDNDITMRPTLLNGSDYFFTGTGIALTGGASSHHNLISRNTILSAYTSRHNQNAISIDGVNNDITNNVMGELDTTDRYGGGIYIRNVGNNVKENNILDVAYFGIKLDEDADMNVISDNVITDSSVGILLVEGSNNYISGNNITGNTTAGISLDLENSEHGNGINDNDITANYIFGNHHGIRMLQAGIERTKIYKNTIEENTGNGLIIPFANINNIIYGNRFILNTLGNGIDNANDNEWFTVADGGNYWDDYTGSDLDNDGFGDVPYDIAGTAAEQDEKPLMGDDGDIFVTPASLSFVTYQIHKPAPFPPEAKEITISNQGNESLFIMGIHIEGGESNHFSIKNNPCAGTEIAANGACIVTVAYNPGEADQHAANITIISNDPHQGLVRVPVNGDAILLVAGDVNANGHLDLADLIHILQFLSGLDPLVDNILAGDYDMDGKVTLQDALALFHLLELSVAAYS